MTIVIPNCVNYPDSMVVLDIKLENWFMSAGYRTTQLKQECYLFAPAGYADNQAEALKGNIKSHRWNPLDCVGRSDLQRESKNQCPQLLSRHPWVNGWIDSQEQYLLAIAETAHIGIRNLNRS